MAEWRRIVHIKSDALSWSHGAGVGRRFSEDYGLSVGISKVRYEDGDTSLWGPEADAFTRHLAENWQQFPHVFEKLRALCADFVKASATAAKTRDLVRGFARFSSAYGIVGLAPGIILALGGDALQEALRTATRGRLDSKQLEQVFLALSTPEGETATGTFHRKVLEHASQKMSEEQLRTRAAQLAEEYAQLGKFFLSRDPWTAEDVLRQIREAQQGSPEARLQELERKRKEGLRAAERTLEQLGAISPDARRIGELLREVIYLRTWRLDQMNLGCYRVAPLLESIARRAGASYNELVNCTREEVEAFLKEGRPLPLAEARERAKAFTVEVDGDAFAITTEKVRAPVPVQLATQDWTRVGKIQVDPLSVSLWQEGSYARQGKIMVLEPYLPASLWTPGKYVDSEIYQGTEAIEEYVRRIRAHPDVLVPHLIKRVYELHDRLVAVATRLAKRRYAGQSLDKLKAPFLEWLEAYEDALAIINPMIVAPERVLTDLLKEAIAKRVRDPREAERYFGALTTTSKPTPVTEELRALLEIALRIQRDEKARTLFEKPAEEVVKRLPEASPILKALEGVRKTYARLGLRFLEGRPYELPDYVERLRGMLREDVKARHAKVLADEEAVQQNLEKALRELKLNPEERKLVDYARELVFLRTYRLDCYHRAAVLVMPLVNEVAGHAGLTWRELIQLTKPEIDAFFNTGQLPPKQLVEERMRGYAAANLADGTVYVTQGEGMKALAEERELPILLKQELKKVVKVQLDLFTDWTLHWGTQHFARIINLPGLIPEDFNYHEVYVDADIYFPKRELQRFNELIKAAPFEVIPKGFERMQEMFNALVESAKRAGSQPLSRLSLAQLGKLFDEHEQVYKEATSFMLLPAAVDTAVSELLKEKLRERGVDVDKYFLKLTTPQRETQVSVEQEAFLELAAEAKKRGAKAIEADLKAHQKKYAWLGIRAAEGKPFTLEDYQQKLEQALHGDPEAKLREIRARVEAGKREHQEAIRELKLSGSLLKLVQLAQDAIYLRTWRLERVNLSNYHARLLYEEIAKRMGIDYYGFIYLTPPEIEEFLRTGRLPVSAEVLKERRRGYACIDDGEGNPVVYTGAELARLKEAADRAASGPAFAADRWVRIVKVQIDTLSYERCIHGLYNRSPKQIALEGVVPSVPMPTKYVDSEIYIGAEAMERLRAAFLAKPHEAIPHAYKKQYEYGDRLVAFAEKLRKTDVRPLADGKLFDLFHRYMDVYEAALAMINITAYPELVCTELLKAAIRKRGHPDPEVDRLFAALALEKKETTVMMEQRDLRETCLHIQKTPSLVKLFKKPAEQVVRDLPASDSKLHARLQKHIERYGWLGMRLLEGKLWDLGDAVSRIQHLLEEDVGEKIRKAEEAEKARHNLFEETVQKLKLTPDEEKLLDYTREVVFLRTHRFEQYNYSAGLAIPLVREVARRLGYDFHQLIYLSMPEVDEMLKTGKRLPKELAEERRRAYGMVSLADGTVYITQGEGLKALAEAELGPVHANEVRGQVAYPGKAVGEVVVINGPQDFHKFSRGKIMVTQMTTPDFVPVMEKAKAIVTDIGGITTHAAIVSRELGVTCIIGTEKGTKVFKDGDLVFVNTDESTVRKVTQEELHKLEKELSLEAKKAVKQEKARVVQEVELRGDLVMDFAITKKQHLPLVGGKGASLGEMFGKFPVPDGFVVTTNTYKAFIEESGAADKIHHLLEKLNPEDTAALEKTARLVQDLITSAKMSAEHEKAILDSYQRLGEGFVAVRSSATAEDLPGASFAGLQATLLNVKGRADVLEAVKRCWASLFTPRAILYRSVKKFEHEKVHMAVVVQRMVESKKAGVMFTANPVTKNTDEMVIEGSWGLGESVVSGQVTPDGFVVDKLDLTIKDRHEGDKRLAIERDPKTGRNVHRELPPEEARKACLSDREVQELARIGKHVEEHYQSPQDIEWAIDAQGRFYVLQSRPITTL